MASRAASGKAALRGRAGVTAGRGVRTRSAAAGRVVQALALVLLAASAAAQGAVPLPVTARAPGVLDDAAHGYPAGSTWLFDGVVHVSLSAAPGAAQWLALPAPPLPLDAIGLRVRTLAPASGGAGYRVGEVLTLTGGATARVTAIVGAGGTGALASASVADPAFHACANTAAGGLAQRSSSGSGRGASFTATFLSPVAVGARLLTRCHTADRALGLAFGSATATVGFGADGLIDAAAVDALFAGVRPRITVAYDQGGNGVDGTEAAVKGGTISALRAPHGIRSILMDGDPNGPGDSGAPANFGGQSVTALDWGPSLSIDPRDSTLVWAGGLQSADHGTGIMNSGPVAVANRLSAAYPNLSVSAGGGSAVACPGMAFDRDNVLFQVSTAAGTRCVLNGASSAVGGGVPPAAATSGGTLGYGRPGFAYVDYDMAAFVPWAMSDAEVAVAAAAIDAAFLIAPQARSVIVADGDSDTDGHGAPAQNEWPRMMMEQLGRPDIRLLDTAYFGSTMGGAAANGAPGSRLSEQALDVLPALDQAHAGGAANRWVVMGPMGFNDLNRGDSLATVEAAYTAYCDAVHRHHGLCALLVVPNRAEQTGGIFPELAALGAWIMASTPDTNAHADLAILSPGCPASLACQQSDGVHATQINALGQARAVAAALGPRLR